MRKAQFAPWVSQCHFASQSARGSYVDQTDVSSRSCGADSWALGCLIHEAFNGKSSRLVSFAHSNYDGPALMRSSSGWQTKRPDQHWKDSEQPSSPVSAHLISPVALASLTFCVHLLRGSRPGSVALLRVFRYKRLLTGNLSQRLNTKMMLSRKFFNNPLVKVWEQCSSSKCGP